LGDEELRAMLEARADRASGAGLLASVVAEVERAPRRLVRRSTSRWPRLAWVVALVAVVVIGTVSVPGLLRATPSGTPAPATSATSAASAAVTTSPSSSASPEIRSSKDVHAITAPELVEMLGTSAAVA
jgi:hypothetical protein